MRIEVRVPNVLRKLDGLRLKVESHYVKVWNSTHNGIGLNMLNVKR